MMLRERWLVMAILGLGLAAGAPSEAGQAVKPKHGAPPDQAVQPDQNAPLATNPIPEPAPPPEPDPPEQSPTPQAAPAPAAPPAKAAPVETVLPEPSAATEPAKSTGPPASPEQQQLEKDTARLLQLVQELQIELKKAGSDTLSLEALRKADEVQRLTRVLKERMKERGRVPQTKAQ